MHAPSTPALSVAEHTHNAITVRHWGRLLDAALLATSSRIPWAELLRRTHGVEVLVCPECGGGVRVLAAIIEPAVASAILGALGVPGAGARPPKPKPSPPPRPTARLPSRQLELPLAGG